MKQIKWFLRKIIALIVDILFYCVKKDDHLYLFGIALGANNKEYFMHNSKYLFLKLQNNSQNIRTVWLCDNEQMLEIFKANGFSNVFKRNSIKGIWSIIKAKYWICDFSSDQISKIRSRVSKSISINLWHGASGLKKVENDAKLPKNQSIQGKIYQLLKPYNEIFIVNSKYETSVRKSAFNIQDDSIKLLGSPRLDILYNDIPNSEIFMEKDFTTIKLLKNKGKKLIFYTPTYRDTGKDISGWLKSDKLKNFLKENSAILVCKLHFADINSLNFQISEEFYKMNSNSDIYPVLKYSDALITDYSSIYFDYLHLDKPVIYHIPDLKEYTEQCRGFYRSYETLTAGVYTRTEDELLSAIADVIKGIDNYKEQRKKLLDEMFVYQDGNNCERVVEWLKSLDK